jgi:hypothetical protein
MIAALGIAVAFGFVLHIWWQRWSENRQIARERYRMFKGFL